MRLTAAGLMLVLFHATPVAAGLELPPPIVMQTYTCRELLALDGNTQERAIIYIGGVTDGRRQATVLDRVAFGNAVERMLALCRATPDRSALEAFSAAWK
jgi:hypothetical protein